MTGPRILVDTWAWIEMMRGSGQGDHVRTIIRNNPEIFVSVLTIYELRYRLEQLMGAERALSIIHQIREQVNVIPVDNQIAMLGGAIKIGQTKERTNMGAVDCMILATARVHDLKILSGDKHFAGLDEAMQV